MAKQALVTISKEFIPPGKENRPGIRISPSSITIHNTDNSDVGAGAKAHSSFVRRTGYYLLKGKKQWVSWHFTVDDSYIIQQLPIDEVAYHAGSAANASSIAIEICMNSDNDQPTANRHAAGLVANLIVQLGLDISDVKKHQDWTGKNCPALLISANQWNAFISLVEQALAGKKRLRKVYSVDDMELQSAQMKHRPPANVPDYDIDHHLLTKTLKGSASDLSADPASVLNDLSSGLRQIFESVSEFAALKVQTEPRLFFPQGINEISISLAPTASLSIKGPASSLNSTEVDEASDSVPEDDDLSLKTVLPSINERLPEPSEFFYGTHSPDRRYGIRRTIEALTAVARQFHSETGLRVGIGDISKLGGGRISGHDSHQKGVDVDIRLPRIDGKEEATTYHNASYSRERTQLLVNAFRNNRVFPIKYIFFNDPKVEGVSYWRNHHNHLHVRFDIRRLTEAGETS